MMVEFRNMFNKEQGKKKRGVGNQWEMILIEDL